METIRILHIGLSPNIGGIETVVYSWFKRKPEWMQFDFVNVYDSPIAYEAEFVAAGGNVYYLTARARNPIKAYLQLRDVIVKGNYDYVHHHIMSFASPEPCLIVNQLKKKTQIIMHSHTVLNESQSRKYRILDALGRLCLKNAGYNRVSCGYDAGTHMFRGEKFHVIKNGVDFSASAFNYENRQEIRSQLGIKETDILIGHVGRDCYEKNYPFLLGCFADAVKQNESLKLLLIGDILQAKDIQNRIDNLEIRNRTICTGKVKSALPYYSAMDIFFMPSIVEGVSLALLEAQISGLPCVVSDTVASETRITDLIKFVSIDGYLEASDALCKAVLHSKKIVRECVQLDQSYNSDNTAQAMIAYYLTHANKH